MVSDATAVDVSGAEMRGLFGLFAPGVFEGAIAATVTALWHAIPPQLRAVAVMASGTFAFFYTGGAL